MGGLSSLLVNAFIELNAYLAALVVRLRARRLFAMVLEVEVIGDIVADVATGLRVLNRKLHRTEVNVREAMSLLRKASAPDSPGGRAITPAERAPIERLLDRAAEEAHDATELARC